MSRCLVGQLVLDNFGVARPSVLGVLRHVTTLVVASRSVPGRGAARPMQGPPNGLQRLAALAKRAPVLSAPRFTPKRVPNPASPPACRVLTNAMVWSQWYRIA